MVSGCGFTPLYGPYSSEESPGVERHLAQLKLASAPATRNDQILHNHLLDKLTPAGVPTAPEGYLHVDLTLSKNSISLRKDGTTQRFNMVATAHIMLRDRDNKKTLYTDTVKRIASFSIGEATAEYGYASTVSEVDAKRRTLLLVAEDMHIMLATYYKKWPAPKE